MPANADDGEQKKNDLINNTENSICIGNIND